MPRDVANADTKQSMKQPFTTTPAEMGSVDAESVLKSCRAIMQGATHLFSNLWDCVCCAITPSSIGAKIDTQT